MEQSHAAAVHDTCSNWKNIRKRRPIENLLLHNRERETENDMREGGIETKGEEVGRIAG
jgi:hypothetical protein